MDLTTACFAKKGEFVSRSIAGETILVPVRGQVGDLDSIYNFNDVGAYVWERIDSHTSVRQIVSGICEEFEVTPEGAATDTLEFLGALEAAGIVERLEGA